MRPGRFGLLLGSLRESLPSTWRGAGLRAWSRRRQPRGPRAARRGCTPWRAGAAGCARVTLPSPTVWLLTRTGALGWTAVARRWGLLWPGASAAPSPARRFAQLRFAAATPPLGVAAVRLRTLLGGVWRALGGVCRLKLRYKGKSFKWHRRRGALLLRFGHSHLVAVPTVAALRAHEDPVVRLRLLDAPSLRPGRLLVAPGQCLPWARAAATAPAHPPQGGEGQRLSLGRPCNGLAAAHRRPEPATHA
jgi:hypothetical protein